jgi:hypothetical protein
VNFSQVPQTNRCRRPYLISQPAESNEGHELALIVKPMAGPDLLFVGRIFSGRSICKGKGWPTRVNFEPRVNSHRCGAGWPTGGLKADAKDGDLSHKEAT